MLHQHNSYVRSFKKAAEIMDDNTKVDYRTKISGKAPLKEHKGRFNAPSVSEVAIIIAGELCDHLKYVIVRDEDGDILEIKPCSTSIEACQVLGLLEDDSHWYQAMDEAAVSQSPAQRRNLFAILVSVYPNIQQNFKDQDWLSHRAILSNRNDVVEKLNVTIQKQLPGQEYAYKSIDCILNDDEAVQYPIEFMNFIQTPDLQAHNLILKVSAPIMLIRNIDAPRL
ncbi:ATP-dependent DNA helicase [Trichonephila inaurata madagascariensis]|uniref:ATP-dependent DNA helicase n=1 Tax=Trichonephila inaurata madagascariensis TaxID=2747483 RepID=A0A8X6M903_9ARAC|nr:ATP-dependent DNA helicase [Trichonephila inaurata madagascariensis]